MIPKVDFDEELEFEVLPSKDYKMNCGFEIIHNFVDELEAMKQVIFKILNTERYQYLIYSWNYGIETEAVVGKSFQVFTSEIKRVIREALLADSRITDVVDFVVERIDKRTAHVTFTAETIFGPIPIERTVKTSV